MSPTTLNCKYLLNITFKPIKSSQIFRFLYDAKRFIPSYYSIADSSPLQLYSSALIFAPKNSIIRNTFHNHIPDWVLQEPNTDLEWNVVLQTLEGHSAWVNSAAFLADSKLLASASHDKTIKVVWDTATDILQQTLEEHGYIKNLSFDITKSILIADIGCFRLKVITKLPLPSSSREINSRSHRQGLGVSGSWVIWNGQNLLWSPPDFRATTSVISHTGSILAIRRLFGKVAIIGINNPYSNIL